MSDALLSSTVREDDPRGLARTLRVMAASIPEDQSMTLTLTPKAARIAARAIEAGMTVGARPSKADRPDTGSTTLDMLLRERMRQRWALAFMAAALAVSFAVLLVLP